MKQLKTKAIVLGRLNYRETDRLLTVLTPDYGKLSLIAKGARAMKSKLAGGIELFSINDIGFMTGKGEMHTLTSSRLDTYYPNILKDMARVQLGYDLLRLVNKLTEDQPGEEYFRLLQLTLATLNDDRIGTEVVKLWFLAQLISVSGHKPNLLTDAGGGELLADLDYAFDAGAMAFRTRPAGRYGSRHIKMLRLAFDQNVRPAILERVFDKQQLIAELLPLVENIRMQYL